MLKSRLSWTLESEVFTPCPPGPEECVNRSMSSPSGITNPLGAPGPGGMCRSSMVTSFANWGQFTTSCACLRRVFVLKLEFITNGFRRTHGWELGRTHHRICCHQRRGASRVDLALGGREEGGRHPGVGVR